MHEDKRRRREATTVPEMRRVLPPDARPKAQARKRRMPTAVREEVTADLEKDERFER